MNRLPVLIITLLYFFVVQQCATRSMQIIGTDSMPASALKVVGRHYFNPSKQLALVSSAAHVGYTFHGETSKVYVSLPGTRGHNYVQYEVDGVYQRNVRIDANSNQPITVTARGAGPHTVWLYKTTEAHTGPVFLHSVTGKGVTTIEVPSRPSIEFIGNSITCGAAADTSMVPCGKGEYHDQHNAYFAYGPRVARVLKANFMLSSVSGIGVYRNWNSHGPAMPQVYEKVDFVDNNAALWNFSNFSPDVVSIALGTNDFSRGDGKQPRLPFDSATFVGQYSAFVKQVKAKYPAAQMALLSSAMVHGSDRTLLENCLTAVKKQTDAVFVNSKPVALYFFKPMQAHGCTGHPSVADHGVLADELVPFFAKLLK